MPKQLSLFISAHRTALGWVLAALLSLGLRWWSPPAFIEQAYSRGVFLAIRWLFDLFTGLMPMALLYLILPISLWWLFRGAARTWQLAWPWPWRVAALGVRVVGLLAAVLTLFLWVWGFNYGRVPVEQQLGLSQTTMPLDSLIGILQQETADLIKLRAAIPGASVDSVPLPPEALPSDVEAQLSEGIERVLAHEGYPTVGRVRARLLYPKGIFLRFSSSGLYFPFTGEGHVDAGLIPLQRSAVMAHEMAHGYGFGDEGVCSFWAYVVCYRAQDPAIAYTGRLSYWRSLASIYKRYRPEAYASFRAGLPPGMLADIDAINENLLAYPDIMPRVRYAAYDAYLKAQGIAEGMLNYGRVIELVEAWRSQNQAQ